MREGVRAQPLTGTDRAFPLLRRSGFKTGDLQTWLMKMLDCCHKLSAGLLWGAMGAALACPPLGWALEDTFPLLEIGTRTYTNVTVTTKAPNYIFILYAGGMTNIKVKDLPPDLLVRLGYAAPKPSASPSNATTWAKQAVAKIDAPQIKRVEERIHDVWRERVPTRLPQFTAANSWLWISVVVGGLLAWLFFCQCCTLICRKAGHPPNMLICLPFFQQIPLFQAAGMSAWWSLACLVPLLNILSGILWAFNITKARGKHVLVAILLLLPLLNVLAFLYLAFSCAPHKQERTVEIMSLEAA